MITFKTKGLVFFLLIVLCLITGALAQAGGGRSRSSSRSRSRSRKKQYSNCTTVNGKTTCYDDDQDDGQGFGFTTVLAILVLVGIKGYDYFIKYMSQTKKKETRERVLDDFTTRIGDQSSTLDIGARQEIIGSLKSKSFNMVFTTRGRNDPVQCRLKVNSLEKVTDDLYKIKLSGTDEVGRSTFDGYLAFKGDGVAWKLQKNYDNKRTTGQTGGFENLFYEGAGGIARMEGKWAFYGYEWDPQYSGTWFMVPV